jgi:hypothetical protein
VYSTEFEIVAKFQLKNKYDRSIVFLSKSTSEMLNMFLNSEPESKVQTEFGGTSCEFEVKRSREEEIEIYSSGLKNCASNADYEIHQNFKVLIRQTDGQGYSEVDAQHGFEKYVNYTASASGSPILRESKVTLNNATMTKDDWQLSYLYYYVMASSTKSQDIPALLMWRFDIVKHD